VAGHRGGLVQVEAGWRADGGPVPSADRLTRLLGGGVG
jgi:hypothetical protein